MADITYEYNLRVIDDDGAWSEVDTATVTIIAPFAAPVANAGSDRTVAAGSEVILDGTGSTVDHRGIASYAWERTGGTQGITVALTGANTSSPVLIANTLEAGTADAAHVFELTVTDSAGNSDTDTVTITVEAPEAPNLPPVADAGPDRIVASGETYILDGADSTDSDGSVTGYHWWRTGGHTDTGSYMGTTNPPSSGSLWYVFGGSTLKPGAADITYEYNLRVIDDDGAWSEVDTVTVTIIAPFAAPVANAGSDRIIAAGRDVILDGTGSTVDRRRSITSYNWIRTGGTGGESIVLTGANTAKPVFTANALEAGAADVAHVFELTVTDSAGNSDTDTVSITVEAPEAPNLPPVADAGPDQTVVPGDTVTLDGSGSSDSDGTIASYAWERTGGTVGFTVTLTGANTARPVFTADALEAGAAGVTHVFKLTVRDSSGATANDKVTIRVKAPEPANLPPVAQAGPNREVVSGATVQLDGSRSSDRDGTITYSWTRTGGTAGGSVVLNNPNTAYPDFTADILAVDSAIVRHIFTLTVTDDDGATDTDIVKIRVAPNVAPVANAGLDQVVASGVRVRLDGRNSTAGRGRGLSYSWARTGGTEGASVALIRANRKRPKFTADRLIAGNADVTHIFTLTVRNSSGETATDTVTITVQAPEAPNLPPVANAGPDLVVVSGETYNLDGSGSTDNDGSIAGYGWWHKIHGSGSGLYLGNSPTPTWNLTAETLEPGAADITHEFNLRVVDDDDAWSGWDTVRVTITAPFAAPIANAGPNQAVASGATVTLDGGDSTHDYPGGLDYEWVRSGGTGGSVILSNANVAQPTFITDILVPGANSVTHIFTLTVKDNSGETAIDTVTITVEAPEAPNLSPVANAGPDQVVASGTTVQLDGGGSSDTDGTIVFWSWQRIYGTPGSLLALSDANTARPSFTADILPQGSFPVTHGFNDILPHGSLPVTHEFKLTVRDDDGAIATDRVTITVESPFAIPVANAGDDRAFVFGSTVQLDGSGSTVDHRGTIASYAWERTGGTPGVTVTLTGGNTARPTFIADALTESAGSVVHIFTLTITDNTGAKATDIVRIEVTSPNDGLLAEAGKNQTVFSGTTVILDGADSAFDSRDVFSHAWKRVGGTAGTSVTLIDANTIRASFTSDILDPDGNDVIHIFELTVTDSAGNTDSDTVTITIMPGFEAIPSPGGYIPSPGSYESVSEYPVANAGPDQIVLSGTRVVLDGSGSTEHDESIASWAWTQTGGSGDSVILTGANTAQASFTPDELSTGAEDVTYAFMLTVTDDAGETFTDTVSVTVQAPVANADLSETAVSEDTVAAMEVDIQVSPSELIIREGDAGTYRVRLDRSPEQEVSVTAFSGNGDIVLKNTRLEFNAENWNEWQNVGISNVADFDTTDDTVQIRHGLVANGVTLDQSETVNVTIREVDPVLRPVGQYLESRATALLNNQPGLSSFLKQDELTSSGDFTLQATDGRLAMDGGFIRNGAWGQVTGSYANSEFADTKSVLASFGIHRRYSETFLAGAMLQFDLAENELAALNGRTGKIDGKGWLIGPYFAARHAVQPLYFEGRLLYGQSDNDIRFIDPALGTRTGSFDSKRLLAQVRVEGDIVLWDRAEGSRLIPYADVRWVEDRAAAFTDNIDRRVPGQKISTGQLELGSNVEIPIAVGTGAMTLTGGLGLVWSNTEGDYIPSDSRGRGRGEIGFSYALDDNLRIGFESFYDGIGASGYESYGLSINAEMRF